MLNKISTKIKVNFCVVVASLTLGMWSGLYLPMFFFVGIMLVLPVLVLIVSRNFNGEIRKILKSGVSVSLMIIATVLAFFLLNEPALYVDRCIAISRAQVVINYIEVQKKGKGFYPEIEVDEIGTPGIFGIEKIYYYCKEMEKSKSDGNAKKKRDYYSISFRQRTGFLKLDSFVIMYRSDNDYSDVKYLKDAPFGWKYTIDRF